MVEKKVVVATEFNFQGNVIDQITSAVLAALTPAQGDRYIVTDGANQYKIAMCTTGGASPVWEYITPTEGFLVWDESEDKFYKYISSWTVLATGLTVRGTFTNASLSAGVLTITHNLSLSAPYTFTVIIFDNNGKQIIPDEITGATNSVAVDLTSFGALTGTWGYVYCDIALDGIPSAYLDIDGTLAANSDVKIPSQKAVKTYADGKISKTVAGEIAALTEKTAPLVADLLLLESNADSNAKRKVQLGNLLFTITNNKTIATTRDVSLTSTWSITGVGFMPRGVIAFAAVDNGLYWSVGFTDSLKAGGGIMTQVGTGAGYMTANQNLIYYRYSADTNNSYIVNSFDSDGITIGCTKNGSPTGTYYVRFLFFR